MRFLLLSSLLLLSTCAFGQASLSLSEAAKMTFATNHAIKAADYQLLTAKRERQAALGLYAPQFNLNSAWVYAQKDISIDANPLKNLLGALDVGSLLGLDWRYTIQKRSFGFIEADITMPIFMGGKIIAANRAATITEKLALTNQKFTQSNTFTELIDRYFALSLARNATQLRAKVVESLERHLDDVETLKQNGMATAADCLYVEYRLAEAEQRLSAARATEQLAHSALCATTGCDTIGILSTPIFYTTAIESLSHFKALAEDNNLQLEQVAAERELAKQNIAIHRAEFMPQIVAMGGGALTHQVTDLLPRWVVGVGLNFKLFDGLRREYNYSAAKSSYRRVVELESAAKQDISLLVTNLYNKTIVALEQVLAQQRLVDFAKEFLTITQCSFHEGVATSVAVIDATVALAVAQIEQLEAAYNFDTNLARLLEAAGIVDQYFRYSESYSKYILEYETEKK